MTYKEHYQVLHHELTESWGNFFKIDSELSKSEGFNNISDSPDHNIAYHRWQIASVSYYQFLSSLKGRQVDPNDEFAHALFSNTHISPSTLSSIYGKLGKVSDRLIGDKENGIVPGQYAKFYGETKGYLACRIEYEAEVVGFGDHKEWNINASILN